MAETGHIFVFLAVTAWRSDRRLLPEVHLSVIALDFRIQKQNYYYYYYFLPNRAFPSGIVSEHDNGTCLHGDVDFVTENTPEALSPVKPIMPCVCAI